MTAFLIIEEGPLAGRTITLEEGDEWIIGRDPDVCYEALQDPMVSRKHVMIRKDDEGYKLENLSAVNPASINGEAVTEPTLLKEGDAVQIGNVFLRYTKTRPEPSSKEEVGEETPTIYEEGEDLDALAFRGGADARWIIKVISGPNAGGEFGVHTGGSYIMGKDPNVANFVFQDLTVSSKHAKITAHADGVLTIEDLGSKNSVLVNGKEIEEPTQLNTQDLVALGTTSFLIIDREQTRETIIFPSSAAPGVFPSKEVVEEKEEAAPEEVLKKNWKELIIPFRHLIIAGVFGICLIFALGGVFSLFKSESITVSTDEEMHQIDHAIKRFPEVEYSFNTSTGKIFLLGHVMTEVDHQEMTYLLRSLRFIQNLEDNVIIDELVWENTNALMMKNPLWRGVSLSSIIPGHFVLRGYVSNLEEATKLSEYINLNFPYLDKLDNQVVVENTLEAQIQSILLENQFVNVTFQFANGELILAGRVGMNNEREFTKTVSELKKVRGIRLVKNFVVIASPSSDVVNITSKFKVTGSSKFGSTNQYVVIGGRILSKGDSLEGMMITAIDENAVFLEKDGIKYRINYNQQ